MCLSFISHASTYMPLELILIGSYDLLSIGSYDTLIRNHACSNSRFWRKFISKTKQWQLSCLCPQFFPMPHTYMRKHSLIPHSYLLHFEPIQTCCLSSRPCTSSTLIIHEHDTKHCPSNMKIMQRLVIPLKEKDYKKVGHHAHDLHLKKKERGKMTRAKI